MKQYKFQIKWTARIIGLLSSLYFVIFYIGAHIKEIIYGQDRTYNSVLFLLFFIIAGYIFAWFKEREGGLIMLFGGLLLGMYLFYSEPTTNTFLSIVYALPFCIPGLLFYWYSNLNGTSNRQD